MVARQQALLHPAGDHFTLINVFNAFHQRECQAEAVGGQRPVAGTAHTPSSLSFRERPRKLVQETRGQ